MANVFTALAPVLYSAAQEVSNEPFGIVDNIYKDFDNKGVAVGDSIKVPVAPVATVSSYTASMSNPTGTDATASSVSVAITNTDKVSWNLTAEQQRSLENGGNDREWIRQMIAQGMRALRNKAELAAWTAVRTGASRAVGTAGTTPFASNLDALVDLRKVLRDNGAPMADLQFVCDTAAETNLLKLGIIQQAYQAGSDEERRQGKVARQFGFKIGQSAQISTVTKGTGTSYVTSGSTAPGVTDIALVTGTGTVLAGDIVTFAADSTNKYVVGTGVAAPGTISLNRPGAKVTIATANAMTIGNNFVANVAFEKNSVVGVVRPPLIPANPTINQMQISDASGLTYLLLEIVGYGMKTWELHLAYGFKAVQSEHIALLLG